MSKQARPYNFNPSKEQIHNNEPKTPVPSTFTNVKTYSIGKRLVEKIAYSPGPGFYQHEKSEAATKCRNPTHRMDSSPKRPDNFSKVNQGYIAEPGMYSVQP